MLANSGDFDQATQNSASELGLRCLHMSHKNDARLTCIWVNQTFVFIWSYMYITKYCMWTFRTPDKKLSA